MVNFKRYFFYLLRWQLSTPILAIVLVWLSTMDKWIATMIANLIGGLIFFWVDKFIFETRILSAQWEVMDNVCCVDCGKTSRGYRLVKTENYDRVNDKEPEFRCEGCSQVKANALKKRGVKL